MAIIAPQTAPNFATGNYHRILKAEILCGPDEPVPRYHILVGFYASPEARELNTQPMYVHSVNVPFEILAEDPRVALYDMLMESPLFKGTNATTDEK
jgi:hypothetical protein